MAEKIATREAYGAALAEFGVDERIVVLDADLSKSTKTVNFLQKYPERFINMGIAEANMMTVAAGLASCGKIVFASTFAMFAAGRAYEQVRNSICYPKLNVKIGASHAGITLGEDGASHQAIEDIALMNVIPKMTVFSPADSVETRLAVKAAIDIDGPVYLRLGRLGVPILFDQSYNFEVGKGKALTEGNDAAIIATGYMVHVALEAAEILKNEGIFARVINIGTIKPIDKEIIVRAAKETRGIVTAEEHSVIGGLGSIVSSVLAENFPARVSMVGIKDKFGKSGKPADLVKKYGLTAENIVNSVKNLLSSAEHPHGSSVCRGDCL